MPRRKLPYKEGDWFAVPLPNGGFVLGLAVRISKRGIVLGYFFGGRQQMIALSAIPEHVRPSDAFYICTFGDIGLLSGDWPILGSYKEWQRETWPLPDFGRVDVVDATKAFRTTFSEDLVEILRDVPVSPEEARNLPPSRLHGYISLQRTLERILDNEHKLTL